MQIHISRDGQSYGPYTPAQITEMLQNGAVAPSDSVWVQSTEWEKVSTLDGIFGLRPESPTGVALHITRSAATLTGGSGGLSSSQAATRHLRVRTEIEPEGTDNLMKGAIGL